MKRLVFFTAAFLTSTIAFSQHPGSRGGNPLFWVVAGGIGCLIMYVFSYLVGWLINQCGPKNKEENPENRIEQTSENTKKDISPTSTLTATRMEPPEIQSEGMRLIIGNEETSMFCKYCGKRIEADSIFCKYCGKRLKR